MKHLRTYLYILLCIQLFAGLSQASMDFEESCIQCTVSYESQQPSCCRSAAVVDVSSECCKLQTVAKTSCPHSGFCQPLNSPAAAAAANSTVLHKIGYALSTSPVVRQPVFSVYSEDTAISPPLLQPKRQRYILHCSFLI